MNPFDITGRVAVVTGGYGVIGSVLARGLANAGARVAILGRRQDAASAEAAAIRAQGGDALALVADATNIEQLGAARDELLSAWGRVDILVNAAGGNVARARSDTISVFEIPPDAFDEWRGGLGLALPVARRVIEKHGGTVWCASGPNARATAALRLPLIP